MRINLLDHPLATPEWESLPATPIRLATRALWANNSQGEEEAPDHRVIHSRAAFAASPMSLESFRVRAGAGYHKCASGQEVDAPMHVVLRVPDGQEWRTVADVRAERNLLENEGLEVDLAGLRTTALVAEVREAATDRWWPGWNLATTGLQLYGEPSEAWQPSPQGKLEIESLDLARMPAGVEAAHLNSEVRFRTPFLELGFRLSSPSWSYMGLDSDGGGKTSRNLLQLPRSMDIVRSGVYPSGVYPVLRDQNAEYLAQGPRLASSDGKHIVGFLASDYRGSVRVKHNTVTYRVEIPTVGQHYDIQFEVLRDRVLMRTVRQASEPLRAWNSSAWHVATDNRVTPSCVLGVPTRKGEAGLIHGPVLWHFPRYGSLRVSSSPGTSVRSDSVRPLDTNTFELKLGETAMDEGDYLLEAGRHESNVEFRVDKGVKQDLLPETPAVVRRMLERHTATAFPFRADTATYSNNGASMHCTTSLADVSALAERAPSPIAEVSPNSLVELSLERWLDGAPSYGSGQTSHGPHRLEDEYVHMAANTLTALARHLTHYASAEWFASRRGRVVDEIRQMLQRDVDGDGLVESVIRRGNSHEHQWSTSWADVISFGWKDAWANASLFETWTLFEPVLRERGEPGLADEVHDSRTALQAAYLPTFANDKTGLIGGWRSEDGTLHDYGFSLVNGAACSTDLLALSDARDVMSSLVQAWGAVGIADFRNGLPLNLWRIPEEDIGGVVFGLPMGGYQQGGMSHHGARVVLDALYRVGMEDVGDQLLASLAETIADDSAFGGVGSGVDWRMWDGTPSGYEGQLVEGFSVLASALRRYGAV